MAQDIADMQTGYYRLQAAGKDAHVWFVNNTLFPFLQGKSVTVNGKEQYFTSEDPKALIVRKAVNDVVDGIQKTAACLSNGKIKICACCERSIQEFGLYSWDDKVG